MTTTEPGVVSTVEDGVLRVVIDRPASMNAVRTETLDAIADAFEKHSADPDVGSQSLPAPVVRSAPGPTWRAWTSPLRRRRQ